MKKLIIISILTILFTSNLYSQDKSNDLKKLLKTINSEKMIDGIVNAMLPSLKQQVKGYIKEDDAKGTYDDYIDVMMKEVKEFSNILINEEMMTIYDKHFTHDEIKDLITFYESNTGKKILEKTPLITADLMNSMSKHMPEFQRKLTEKLEEIQ